MAYFKPNPRRGHTYYNVVETVQTEKGPRQQEVLYVGRIGTLTPEDRWKIERQLTEVDPSLLPDFSELLVEHGYDFSVDARRHPLENISAINALDFGPVAALHAVAEKLGLRAVLETHFESKGGGPRLGNLLLIQTIARSLNPYSVESTARWYPTTALPGLLDLEAERVTGDVLRNSLDYVTTDGMERVHEDLWERVRELYETPEDPLFYDLTTSYFEGSACPLAAYGYSSDKRPDKKQLLLGITVNPDMVPLHHDVYPGNKNQAKTVADAAMRILELDLPGSIVLVLDKGCATTPVRKDLRSGEITDAGEPIEYVASLRREGAVPTTLAGIDHSQFQPVTLPEGASPLAVTEVAPPEELTEEGCRWIASYNEEKAERDADNRAENLEDAEEALKKVAERQYGSRPRSKDDLIEKAENLIRHHSVRELIELDVNERGPPRLSWTLEEDAVAEAANQDGKALFETTTESDWLGPADVALAYRDRDTVEKFMETLKDIANLRPLHVYREDRVRARVFVCVLSVLLYAVLQLELDEADMEMTGMKALENLRDVRRVEFSAEGEDAVVVKTTELSDTQEELAHVLGFGI